MALVQLLLFVVSTSTALLPCAHGHDEQRMTAIATHEMTSHDMTSHDMTSHDMTSHDMTSHDARSHSQPARHGAPATPDASCPWVVGCVGMVQFTLDESWRSVERPALRAAPIGAVLRFVTVDREIESPPPRA